MSVSLGSKVRDSISGFTGIATGRSDFQYGCSRILIEPSELHDGKPVEGHWFDEQRVELVEVRKPAVSPVSSARSGGPQNDPKPSRQP